MSSGPPSTDRVPAESGKRWLAALLIAAAAAVVYSNSFSAPFLLDDLGAIVQNPTLRHLIPADWLTAPPLGTTVSGRPLLNLSFALNYAISGTSVWSYHGINLLIHILAGLTLFGIVRRILERGRTAQSEAARSLAAAALPIGFFAALLWTVHPLQTEAVTYVVQRAESMMGLFYLLTLYAFLRSVDSPRPGRWLVLSGIACLGGAATKEVMVTAPVMVLFFDRCFIAGNFREAWRRRRSYYLGLASTWVLLAILVATTGGNRSGTSGFGVGVSWSAYWLTQFEATVRYLALSVWPHPLVFEYGTFWMPSVASALPYIIPVSFLGGLALYALTRSAKRGGVAPLLGFCGFWFFGILSVTSVVPGIYQMIVEHRMYLPLAAIAVLAALLLWKLLGKRMWIGGAILALAFGAATFARNGDYRSEVALWEDTVAKVPSNETAQTSLAIALFDSGRVADAISHYREALRLKPDSSDTLNDLGCALASVGQYPEAIEKLQAVVKLEPSVAQYRFNLGNALVSAGRYAEAIPQLREAIRLEPGHIQAHVKLAQALWYSGDRDEAMKVGAEGMRLQSAQSH